MNQIQKYHNDILVQRRTLIDLVMTEHYQVENPIAVATMLESMSSQHIRKVFDCLTKNNDILSTKVLNELLVQKNNSNNSAIIVNESVWKDQRNTVLLKEDDNKSHITDDEIIRVIKYGTIASLVPIYFTKDGPARIANGLKLATDVPAQKYNAIRLSLIKLKKLKLHDKIQKASGAEKQKLIKQAHSVILPNITANTKLTNRWLIKKDVPAAAKLAAKQKLITNIMGGVGSVLKTSGKVVLAVAGITALYLLIHKLFNKMNIAAAKACKGAGSERKKCILTYKINACTEIIKKLEEALPGCKDKANPQKCTLSIQKEIWFWSKRKGQYQEALQKLSL